MIVVNSGPCAYSIIRKPLYLLLQKKSPKLGETKALAKEHQWHCSRNKCTKLLRTKRTKEYKAAIAFNLKVADEVSRCGPSYLT